MSLLLPLYRKLSLAGVLALTILYGYGQRVDVELYSSNNGLPQSHVNCVLQDSVGFIWVGTQEGLSRYDGYRFISYSNNPLDTNSLCNNYVSAIVEGRNGVLWIATRNGLCRFDRRNATFKNYFFDPDNPRSLTSNKITNLFIDSRGRLWVKTAGVLHLYRPATDDFSHYPHFNDFFNLTRDSDRSPIFEDSRGRLWLGTKDGLMLFDSECYEFKRFPVISFPDGRKLSYRVYSIFEDSEFTLWLGTDRGLFRFSPKTERFRQVKLVTRNGRRIAQPVRFVGQNVGDSILWLGLPNGYGRYSVTEKLFFPEEHLFYNNQPFRIADVSSILTDRSGVLWIASQTGLVKINPLSKRFKGYCKDKDGNMLFANNIVASVLEDRTGILWVGTWGEGLIRYNPVTKRAEQYSPGGKRYLPNGFVHAIHLTRNNKLLVGTRNGVFLYREQNRSFVDFFKNRHVYVGDVFKSNRVHSIAEDTLGNLYFATSAGLHILRGGKLTSFYSSRNDSLSIPGNEVYDVHIAKNQDIWVATNKGICRITQQLNRVKYFHTLGVSGKHPITYEALCLLESRNGTIWVGTSNGLMGVNPLTDRVVVFANIPNFPISLINSIEEDNRGNLWVSTNNGLYMYNPYIKFVRHYTTSDGLFSNEFNIASSFKNRYGRLYFGGLMGVNYFHPDSLPYNDVKPNICITQIEILDKKGMRYYYPFGIKELKLNTDISSLKLEFAALDFNQPEKNYFRYQMQGLDDSWVEIGNSHTATFSNLNEGVYYFKVMGANSDQVWNPDPIVIRIAVYAPIWASKYAYAAYLVIALGFLIFWLISRSRNVTRINRLLKEREQVMAELELQKEELENKNKNITDSINYAKRIQDAILPPIDMFKRALPDSFILFMPKDIVSGDFYWINETKNKTFVAAVDCTGHGVPGAFMSIIGIELLRNITNVEGVDDAAEVLNRLSISIHETFSSGANSDFSGIKVKDGMDVSFCVIDREYNMLQFAGAFTNLYILRDGKIIELKGDRFSVGMADETGHLLFSSYYIPIQPNDMIYMFTDGYVDQFGGNEGKKFKFRRFRHLLLNIHKLPLESQRKILYDSIMEWKGDLEQVDDILVIGIRADLNCLF